MTYNSRRCISEFPHISRASYQVLYQTYVDMYAVDSFLALCRYCGYAPAIAPFKSYEGCSLMRLQWFAR